MAITEQTPQHDYTATSGQTEFIFTFTLFDDLNSIKVFVGGIEKVRNTDYNVYASDGSNILTTDFPLAGGKVVFNAGLTAGDLVALVRGTTISRSTDYTNNSKFDANTFDTSLDKAIAIAQDLNRGLSAKIGAAEGDTVANLTLPPQADRVSKVLAFDADGNMIASAGSDVAVTAFMAQVLDDADASTARETLLVPRKNYLINGNFNIWQRGTSFSASTTDEYTADRWLMAKSGATVAVSRQAFTLGQTDVPNSPIYYLQAVCSVANSNTRLEQRIENLWQFSGGNYTLSFYAKAASAKTFFVNVTQNFGTSGSASIETNVGDVALTTSWQKFTVSFSVPSMTGKTVGAGHYLGIEIRDPEVAGSTFTLDIAQVQLEKGNVATEFEYRHIADELVLCQRYYRTIYHSDFCAAVYVPNGDTRAQSIPIGAMRSSPTVSPASYTNHSINLGVNGEAANTPTVTWAFSTLNAGGYYSLNIEQSGAFSYSTGAGVVIVGARGAGVVSFDAEL